MFTKIYEGFKNFIKENYIFILIIIGVNLLFYIELPYVIETPGGSIVLNDRVEVEDGYETSGKLGMAYVSVVKGSIPFLLASYVIPDWDIVPKDEMKNENETMDDMYARDRLYLEEAIDNAKIAAFKLAGKDYQITKEIVNISYIDEEAKTGLKIGDVILSVEGEQISSLDDLREIVNSKDVGDTITFKVLRDNKEKEETAVLYETDDGVKAGVSIILTYEIDTEQDVEVDTKSSESGPSGGFMTSLMIYNSLTFEDISKGRYIIGTGTIDQDGNVGEIGGVKYKIIGANRKGADIFFCPMGNFEEAMEVKNKKNLDIQVVGVATLEEAVNYLKSH